MGTREEFILDVLTWAVVFIAVAAGFAFGFYVRATYWG